MGPPLVVHRKGEALIVELVLLELLFNPVDGLVLGEGLDGTVFLEQPKQRRGSRSALRLK